MSYLKALAADDAAEAAQVKVYRDYYAGDHPTYLTDRQKQFLALKDDYKFRGNYCSAVVDIAAERLQVQAFDAGQDDAGKKLAALAWQWWGDNRMDAGQDDLQVAAIRDGEAFLIVDWLNDEKRPRWTVNYKFDGTRGVKVTRHPDTGEVLFASKRWHENDPKAPGQTGVARLTLYFQDRIERYRASPKATGGWAPVDVDEAGQPVEWPTPWGNSQGEGLGVAVIPFTNPGGSEIKDAIPLQDMLNKSLLDLVAGADMEGFSILWASGVQAQIDPVTLEEKEIVLGPGRLVKLSDAQARLGRVSPDDLTRLVTVCDFWIAQVASVTRTPHHIFQRWQQEPPSGESLKQQEVGLLSKTERKQVVFGNAYEDTVKLSARLHNAFGGSPSIDPVTISTVWKDKTVRDEKGHLEVMKAKKEVGVPESQLWLEMGYDQEKVDEFEAKREASRDQALGVMVRQIATAANEGAAQEA